MQKRMSSKEKKLLLEIAREAIVSYVQNGTIPAREVQNNHLLVEQDVSSASKSTECCGLHRNFLSDKPLYKLVQEMAVSAATRDPRFYPMKKDDLKVFDWKFRHFTAAQDIFY